MSASRTAPGDKIQANTPLGGMVPKSTRPILKIEIAEQDRTFLREGLPVLRHRPGYAADIAPATRILAQTRQPVYEDRIALERDHYTVGDTSCPLR